MSSVKSKPITPEIPPPVMALLAPKAAKSAPTMAPTMLLKIKAAPKAASQPSTTLTQLVPRPAVWAILFLRLASLWSSSVEHALHLPRLLYPSAARLNVPAPRLLDEELVKALRDEDVRDITRESSRLPDGERRLVLGIVRQFTDQKAPPIG